MDLDALQNLVNHLNDKSKKFSTASKTILDRAKSLDNADQDLTANPISWVGKGAQAFQHSWMRFHGDAFSSAINLDTTSTVLSKFASNLQGHIDKINDLNAQVAAMTGLTIGLTIVDILQLGLDPVTDAATGASGTGDVMVISELNAEEEAITELDSMTANEIDQVTAQIEDRTQLDQLNIPADQSSEFTELEDQLNVDVQQEPQPLENFDQAQIDSAKFEKYSMDPTNPKNGGKWEAWEELGYDVQTPEGRTSATQDVTNQLQKELADNPAINPKETAFGMRFEVDVPITGPNGQQEALVTIWPYDTGSDIPRLITNWLKV